LDYCENSQKGSGKSKQPEYNRINWFSSIDYLIKDKMQQESGEGAGSYDGKHIATSTHFWIVSLINPFSWINAFSLTLSEINQN